MRVGFTVSKQVGNAVERNRVRRRLREVVRLSGGAVLRPGHDYVLIGRRAALRLPFHDMQNDLGVALGRIHGAAGTGGDRSGPLHQVGFAQPVPPKGRPNSSPTAVARTVAGFSLKIVRTAAA